MTRLCTNCTAELTSHNKSDFCSTSCSDDYWAMNGIPAVIPKKDKKMATKTEVLVTMTDDLTGEEFTEGQGETVEFTFDGEVREIDLSNKNVTAFRKAVEKYLKASRPATRKRRTSTGNGETAAIRAWAQSAGHQVGDRGRIPDDVVAAYREAHE